jgi:HKD family nuclease
VSNTQCVIFRLVAQVEFILQAVTNVTHASFIREIVQLPDSNRIIISVSFVREAGVAAIEAVLQPLAERPNFFVGIRNDITSVQAVKRLLALNVNLYAVDTACRHTIFHPKLYFVSSNTHARALIGSANLTFGGLHNNIEVSTLVDLDLANDGDNNFANEITESFASLIRDHPNHVFLVADDEHADRLFEAGRLADDEIIPAPKTSSTVKKGTRDALRPMRLHRVPPPRVRFAPAAAKAVNQPQLAAAAKVAIAARVLAPAAVPRLVWQSNELKERDLNIPRSGGTNPTGSMGWKKGALENIDQRHYFREEVFDDLDWRADAPPSKYERAWAKFEFIVKNVNYGVFELKISHNTNTKSRSYLQNNFMTQLHWGDAKKYIAKRDLLGRILYLYRKDTTPPEFVIEID